MTTFFTLADQDRYTGQKRVILGRLIAHHNSAELEGTHGTKDDGWVTVDLLEEWSKAKRVASRIDELRDDWEIDMRKNPISKRADYRLVGKLTEPRERKPHCETCRCGQQCMVTVSGHGNAWQCSKDEGHAGTHENLEHVPLEQARLL